METQGPSGQRWVADSLRSWRRLELIAAATTPARSRLEAIERWLGQELDGDGVPRRLDVAAWWPALDMIDRLLRTIPADVASTPRLADPLTQWFTAALRLSRPDGSCLFRGESEAAPLGTDRARLIATWARRLNDPGAQRVVRSWFPRRLTGIEADAPFPLPTQLQAAVPRVVMRPNWNRDGDWLAIDARPAGEVPHWRLELTGAGVPLLGPRWPLPDWAAAARCRLSHWTAGFRSDIFESTITSPRGVPRQRLIRSAVLLRSRGLAILSEQSHSTIPVAWPDMAAGLRVDPYPGTPHWRLRNGRKTVAIVVRPGETNGDSAAQGASTDIASDTAGSGRAKMREWSPLIVCWNRDDLHRVPRSASLTITERGRVCGPEVAQAYRVSWQTGENLVVYRSLAETAPRAFLGHITTARDLVGWLGLDGQFVELAKIDDTVPQPITVRLRRES